MNNKFYEIWEPVFNTFEARYPHVATMIIDWYPCGQNEIVLTTENGDKVIFSYTGETIRRLEAGTAIDDISEEQMRGEFAARLCNRMAMSGVPRWHLSRITGISEVTLSKYMNGRSTPNIYNTRKIARALGCPVSELVDFVV